MQITPDNWTGPGSGTNQVAPNTFWVTNQAGSTNWQFQVTARNASGVLVIVASWSLMLWDVTAGAASLTVNGTSANTININANMLTNGHIYTYAVSFASGSCDHTIITTTSIAASGWKNYPLCSKWNGSAWVEVGGPGLRKWNGSAWVIVNGGVSKYNGSTWVHV